MASFKLSVINPQLALSGNEPVDVEEDGSAEWTVASAGYEMALKYLLAVNVDWKFATRIAELQRIGDSDDPAYDDAYRKPTSALGLVWVRVNGADADWRVVGNQVLVSAPDGVAAKYVIKPSTDEIPLMFTSALELLTRAACYEGLNEDPDEARKLRAEAEVKIQLARTRDDLQGSRRAVFRSRILRRRRGVAVSTSGGP